MNTSFKTLQDIDQFIDHIDECKWLAKTVHGYEIDPNDKNFRLVGSDMSYMISEGQLIKLSVR